MGYLAYDIINVVSNLHQSIKTRNFHEIARNGEFFLHHILTAVLLIYVLYYEFGGSEVCRIIVLYEISTPFLGLRSILRDIGLKKHIITIATEILFYLAFFIVRICIGSYIIYSITIQSDTKRHSNHILVKSLLCLLQLLQYHWFYVCTKLVATKIITMTENQEKLR